MTINQAQLKELQHKFAEVSGSDRKINSTEFQQTLNLKEPYFVNRIFAMFNHDNNDHIDYQEFLDSVEKLTSGTDEEKLEFAFCLHDKNGNGCIDRGELWELIAASLDEQDIRLPTGQIAELVDIFMQKADTNLNGEICFDEFKKMLENSPNLQRYMTVSPVTWLKPRQSQRTSVSWQKQWKSQKARLSNSLKNNWVKVAFLGIYIAINLLLVFNATNHYAQESLPIQIARACGAAINFNGALILIPVTRNLMMKLRKTPINYYLPIDEHLELHKIAGYVMFSLAIIHTFAHFAHYSTLEITLLQSLSARKSYLVLPPGWTGITLLIIFTLMVLTSLDFVRQKGYFDLFKIVHWGSILWLGLMLVHGENFWKWALIPIPLFMIDQTVRLFKSSKATQVVNATLFGSHRESKSDSSDSDNVLGLEVARPASFDYYPSDYVYVQCPAISQWEWHPFTISSAPEQRQILSLHIRSAGKWTRYLYKHFHNQQQQGIQKGCPKQDFGVKIHLDGPYGTPSFHVFKAKYAMLVASGIGVTPFASILQSILRRKKIGLLNSSLQKVHFYWVNRDQKSFEWFIKLLQEIEAEDTDNLFDIHLYVTGLNMISSTLYIARDLRYQQTQVDLMTGLKRQTNIGRPNWEEVFQALKVEHNSQKVDVFYCGGSPELSKTLKKLSNQYSYIYRRENF